MKKIMMIFIGLGLLLSGCSVLAPSPTATLAPTETPVPVLASSADDIIGVWQLGSGDFTIFFQFAEDGTYQTAQRVVNNLKDNPQQLGLFTLESGLLTLVTSNDSPYCAGQSGTYEVRLIDQDQISLFHQEDPCTIRSEYWVGSGIQRVSP
jgi:hypothetical protein